MELASLICLKKTTAPFTVSCTSGRDGDISDSVNSQMQSDTARAFFYQFNKNPQPTVWIPNLNISHLVIHVQLSGFCTAWRNSHRSRKTRCRIEDRERRSKTSSQSNRGHLGESTFAQPWVLTITAALPFVEIVHPQFWDLKNRWSFDSGQSAQF